jgi:D-alanyl-lipoteichoic acid acyltransferase DltB (MBOAT superfamily)
MTFNSPVFLGFLFLVFSIWLVLMRWRMVIAAKCWLTLASLVFYAWWNPIYLSLLLGSIWFNFRMGTTLMRPTERLSKVRLLAFGVGVNLLALAWFKYADFAVVNINALTNASISLPGIALPLGISFFTFTQIAWLVDCSQGKVRDRSALDFTLFVTFFPHLLAGPILHHHEMMSQFASRWTHVVRASNVARGLFVFSLGLFKKVVLADTFAGWADEGFDGSGAIDFFGAWATSLSYTLQLYFDFSGYCDMAIGAAWLFNIRLPINFNSPYKALDVQDFWRRWHITLGRYLRDYIYVPLGGNRNGPTRVAINLMATFMLGGLWHGASWMFVAWGALHGAALVLHRAWKRLALSLPAPLAWLLTFTFVDIAWIFFRAKTWSDASRVLHGMFDLSSIGYWPTALLPTSDFAWAGTLFDPMLAIFPATVVARLNCLIAVGAGLAFMSQPNSMQLAAAFALRRRGLAAAWVAFCAAAIAVVAGRQTAFLYFNF